MQFGRDYCTDFFRRKGDLTEKSPISYRLNGIGLFDSTKTVYVNNWDKGAFSEYTTHLAYILIN